jgi:hypothetical protein
MRPEFRARPGYLAAFRELAARITAALQDIPAGARPVRMYVAGGAAVHFYTGERVSVDVDAVFSRRVALPDALEISYRDEDGAARLLYFDRQYNDTLGLLHEDAHADSEPLRFEGLDAGVLDIRLLAPLDLAVSKLGRWSTQDQQDVLALARLGLIDPDKLEARATEALGLYVGDTVRLQGTIAAAKRLVAAETGRT